jgi:CheY-like chemotaxis protein
MLGQLENSVLLVDDDPSIRDLLAAQLEEAGFEARQAEDGIDGLVKLREELPKVIISDIQMPRMSGIEFVAVVRKRFPSIPVIVFSGSCPSDLPAEGMPDLWIEKSAFNVRELLQALRQLAKKAPGNEDIPQVVGGAVRARLGAAGYFVLTCGDCLRQFRVTNPPADKSVARTSVCIHCEASVPFLVEGIESI